jgi:hypothetical protein
MLTKKELITNFNNVRIASNRPVLNPIEASVVEEYIDYYDSLVSSDKGDCVKMIPSPYSSKGVLSKATEDSLANYYQKKKSNIIELEINEEGEL